MRAIAKVGAVGALIAVLGFGFAAGQTQETATGSASERDDVASVPSKRNEVTLFASKRDDVTLVSWLSTPDGDGPFPAVVLLHGCSGLQKNTQHQTVWRGLARHAALLNENGYVTLIVDSFGPRRIAQSCAVDRPEQQSDAYDALDYLASLPIVDADRIGLVGQSMGGGTALRLAQKYPTNRPAGSGPGTYAALVAYYPYCYPWIGPLDHPVLILIGADDDWTPAHLCRNLHKSKADHVALVVYPDTHHSFDLPMTARYLVMGHVVQANPTALRDSQARMLEFFKEHLGGLYEKPSGGDPDVEARSGGKDFLRVAPSALFD